MSNKDKIKFAALFKIEVSDRSDRIDPDNREDWRSLAVGWAIGKGLKPEDAVDFAIYIRYHTNLG